MTEAGTVALVGNPPEPARFPVGAFGVHRFSAGGYSDPGTRSGAAGSATSTVPDRVDLSGRIHDGRTFGLVAHERVDGTNLAEAAWDAGVLVVPGRFFDGAEGVRLSAGRDTGEEAAGRSGLGEVLDDL